MAIENAKFGKGIALAGGFDLGAKAPLDSRETVATIEERDAHVTGNRAYDGMLVFVEADKITYQYILGEDGVGEWREFGFNLDDFKSQVVDNLTSEDDGKALSAKQGKVLDEKIAENTKNIEDILDEENGILKQAKDYTDSKDNAIQDAKDAADAAQEAADKAQDEVDAVELRMKDAEDAIDAIEEDMGDIDNLQTVNKTVAGAINEVLAAVGSGGTAAVVTVTTDTTTEGALKSYTIKQGTTTVGVIDIPKDMVVESGSVVVNPEGHEAGTYIKLVLANVAEPLFINVGKLVDIYTAEANATQVQISIDASTRAISATIVAGSITAAELAADAVTTVKIADGNVTKAKLSTEVQATLAKADAAVPQATYDTKVAELDKADEDLSGRLDDVEDKAHEHTNQAELDLIASGDKAKWDAAAGKAHEHDNKSVIDGITSDKVTAWDNAKSGAINEAASLDTALRTEMEKYVNSKDSAMDTRVKTIEGLVGDGFEAASSEAIAELFAV